LELGGMIESAAQSVVSTHFQFTGYKIDKLELELYPAIGLVESSPAGDWDFTLNFRVPEFLRSTKTYLVGFNVVLKLPGKNSDEENINLVLLKASIVGTFKVINDLPNAEHQKRMVTQHFPTILLPYFRTTVTTLLAAGGYGSILFPLINLNEMVKQDPTNLTIIERD
jgi:preprotein translocase subunit SecB